MAVSPDIFEYLYKRYRLAMSRAPREMIMPRPVFRELIADATCIHTGEELIEKYLETLITKILEQQEASVSSKELINDTDDITRLLEE